MPHLVSLLLLAPAALVLAATPSPYVVPPSQQWDGVDGYWSTFQFELGSPFQQVRLLPATSETIFAPIANSAACPNNDQSCQNSHGGTYDSSGSSTYSTLGSYNYTAPTNINGGGFGDNGTAIFGEDTVRLAWPGPYAPQINGTLIGALQSDDNLGFYWLGQFGLVPSPTNLSALHNNYPSVLSQLYNASMIPSLSWGYTAGAHNMDPPAFGSLTLGGYDQSKFRPNNVQFNFSRNGGDIVPSLQRITLAGTGTSLLPTAIPINIDSQIPTIVLPVDACRAFERALNLTYSQGYYTLTPAQRSALQAMNPSITFQLGPSLAGGDSVQITLPYSAFDQVLFPPFGSGNGTYYFPLQQATSSAQYVLGRTFLQHAYLTADFERGNYSISQALFAQNAPEDLHTIQSVNSSSSSSSSGLSGGAIAGIVIGVIAGLAIIAGIIAFFIIRKRKQQRAATEPSYDAVSGTLGDASSGRSPASPDMSMASPSQQFSDHPYWTSTFNKAELGGDAKVAPAEAPADSRVEMEAPDKSAAYGGSADPKFAELEEQQRHEIGAGKTEMRFELDGGYVPAQTTGGAREATSQTVEHTTSTTTTSGGAAAHGS